MLTYEENAVFDLRGKCQTSYILNDIISIDGFLQFRGGPGAHQTALVLGVVAMVTAFGQRFGLFPFQAGSTEGKCEFASAAVG